MKGWRRTRLGECCRVVSGATPSTSNPDYWDGDIPWATPKDLSGLSGPYIAETQRKITRAGLESCAAEILPPGSVLFSSRAPIGHVAINTVPMATNQGFKSLVPDPNEVDAKFLYHWLRRNRVYLDNLGRGATFKEISKDLMAEVEIHLPPLDEQRRIAEVLDRAEMLVIKRAAALQQLNTLGQAVFMRLFGEAISASQLPVSLLGEVAEVVSGVTKGRQLRGPSVVEVPYLRVANVQAGFLDLSEVKTIPALPEEVEELRLLPGDVLMTEGGDYDKLGRGAIWDGQIANCIHQNHVFRVRVDRNRLDPKYFTYFLQTPFARRYFLRCAKRTTNLASINMTQLKALPVPLPPVALQREFVRRVEAVEQQIAQYRVSLAQLESLYASLQHRAFRGEL